MTPGLAREREAYVLGAVCSEELSLALVQEFLAGDGSSPDPAFSANVPTAMLMFANGFKTDNTGESPLMRRRGDGPGFGIELIPARPSVFKLPRVGARHEAGELPPSLVSGEAPPPLSPFFSARFSFPLSFPFL